MSHTSIIINKIKNEEAKKELDYNNYVTCLLILHLKIKGLVSIITSYQYKVPQYFINKMNKKIKYHQSKPLGTIFENKLKVFDVVCDFLLDPNIIKKPKLKSFYKTLQNSSNPKSYLKHNNYEVLFLIKKHLKKIQIVKEYNYIQFVVSLNYFSHCCGYIKHFCLELGDQYGLYLQDGRTFTYSNGFDCNNYRDNNLIKKQHKSNTFKTKSYCLDLLKHTYDYNKHRFYWG